MLQTMAENVADADFHKIPRLNCVYGIMSYKYTYYFLNPARFANETIIIASRFMYVVCLSNTAASFFMPFARRCSTATSLVMCFVY